ncbi:ankyrin repeat-containing domain protein [Pelagophyceae sp. CCMP2097]|nr:ankyrin repeat-containing domain protein [Pelagophyceae sp. CCMP2097]
MSALMTLGGTLAALGLSVLGSVAFKLYRYLFAPPKLPGNLQPRGHFSLADPDLRDSGVANERQRDFERVCGSRTFLHVSTLNAGAKATEPKLLDVANGAKTFEELCDAVDAGGALGNAAAVLRESAYALVSATTPFEFAMRFGVPPNFGESRYVLVREQATLRVLWAAFLNDQPYPIATGDPWPYFACFVSEPLCPGDLLDGRREKRFDYFCEANFSNASLGPRIQAVLCQLEAADPVLLAARAGDERSLERLLAGGAAAAAVDAEGKNALIHAVVRGLAPELLSQLIDRGSMVGDGHTALRAAALHGRAAALQLLLRAGADARIPSLHGRTPLMGAVLHRAADAAACLDCVRMLLADRRGRETLDTANSDGDTALHLAALRGNADARALLLAAGANQALRNAKQQTPADVAAARAQDAREK